VAPALLKHGARILPECHVERLECDNSREVRRARATWKGRPIRIKARVFVLALNAILTPALLLRSVSTSFPDGLGNSSSMVGRNLMTHVSDSLFVRLDDRAESINARMTNGASLNDFYVHTNVKLGNVHAHAVHFPPEISARLRGSALFATIVEDFPYFNNRVLPRPGSETHVLWEYHHAPELRTRAQTLTKLFASTLRKVALSVDVARPDGRLNQTHMCGTCRFGDDPRSSVLDRNNRMHDVGNVYVVDASFFPSSGAMNPSLTIVANSLRVSDLIAQSVR
jgi:choline dehydrogenase-like flavoprotein